jgi:hypothetical protein
LRIGTKFEGPNIVAVALCPSCPSPVPVAVTRSTLAQARRLQRAQRGAFRRMSARSVVPAMMSKRCMLANLSMDNQPRRYRKLRRMG